VDQIFADLRVPYFAEQKIVKLFGISVINLAKSIGIAVLRLAHELLYTCLAETARFALAMARRASRGWVAFW
jgi:hypothetical protein